MQPDARRILIVDDEAPINAALQIRLRALGYDVHSAKNGREGLQRVEEVRPHAVVLDIRMPDIDGYEVCRTIRRTYPDDGPAVLFMSANTTDDARLAALEAGGDAFLVKPFKAVEVADTLRALIDQTPTPQVASLA